MARAARNLFAALVAGTLVSACCNDKCVVPRTSAPALLPAHEPDAPAARLSAMPDPTVGLIMSELKEIIGQLGTLAETVGGEARSAIQQAQQSSSQLLAEMDHTLGRRQDRLVRDLEEQERRMVEDAITVINASKRAAEQIAANALQDARETLHETDIVAYNALRDLPCADKLPRLVYAKPFQFRMWANSNLAVDPEAGPPGGEFNPPARENAYIAVRGNYLAYGRPSVRVSVGSGPAHAAQITSLSHNGFVAIVPPEAVAELHAIARPTPLEIKAELPRCPSAAAGPVTSQALPVTVLPPLTYDIATTITPWAEVPTFGTTTTGFSEMGSSRCDDSKDVTQTFSVGPPAEVVDWALNILSLGGNSSVGPPQRSGSYSLKVPAMLRGKGRSCVLGICDCKGRGWVNYGLRIDYKTYKPTPLVANMQTRRVSSTQTSYEFPYQHAFPADSRALSCKYYTRITIAEGDRKTEVELNEVNPNASTEFGEITTRTDSSTCKVTVEVPSNFAAARARSR